MTTSQRQPPALKPIVLSSPPRRPEVQRALTPALVPPRSRRPAASSPAVWAKRRARPERLRRSRLIAPAVTLVLIGGLALGIAWAGMRVQAALDAYRATVAEVAVLRTDSDIKLADITAEDAAEFERGFVALQTDLDRIRQATDLPWKLEWVVERLPWAGERYRTGRQLLDVGEIYVNAGLTGSRIGEDVLAAYQSTGLSAETPPATPTWLDVLVSRKAELTAIRSQLEQAGELRAALDSRYVPDNVNARFDELDGALARVDLDRLIDDQLPMLETALGAESPARYLVLFQNPAELRPSGGFPGTVAIVTIERGQLRSYDFYDIYELNNAYLERSHEPIPQPWALERFAATGELTMLDASWWSDFPTSGTTIMRMYQASGWPPIVGLAAIDPTLVGDLLKLTGPLSVDVDGELREITPDNVHDEIERQRRLHREGEKDFDTHKQVLALIGKEIIERLKDSDRATTKRVMETLMVSADQRDLQVYLQEPGLMSLAEERGWTGRQEPIAGMPTLAISFANVAFGKSSQLMEPDYNLTLEAAKDGYQQATLRIDMHHTGVADDDPFYTGFQRWWIQVSLPAGSKIVRADVPPSPDPAAPNGGSYEIGLNTGERTQLSITFLMPATEHLLIRRQPGLTIAAVSLSLPSCRVPYETTLTSDVVLSLDALCR